MTSGTRIAPLYFGSLGRRLFGCYHPSADAAGRPRDTGIVLCPAQGHESIQFHRAFQKLAAQLSEAGFPVLRFDFGGCGDSEGDEAVWSLEAWRNDVSTAVEELKQQARIPRVALVGLRLGATLAAEVSAARDDVEALVLWDPVVNGSDYLDELRAQHQRMLGYAHVLPAPQAAADEVLGFPLPDALAVDLASVDLLGAEASPAERIRIIESNESVDQRPLRDHLSGLGATVEHRPFSNPHLWAWVEDFGKVHVPRKILDSTVSWLSGSPA